MVNTDSALETFVKRQQKRKESVKDKAARQKREKLQLKADKLVNDLVERRSKIETRSAFLNQHVPTAAGSHTIPEPEDRDMLGRPMFSEQQREMRKPTSIYQMVDSELPKIAPGLVPARVSAIKRAAPSHDKVLHDRLGQLLDEMRRPRPKGITVRSDSDSERGSSSHGGSTTKTEMWNAIKHLREPVYNDLGGKRLFEPRCEPEGV